jgi:hemerythrin
MSHVHGPVLGMPELDAPHADMLSRADDLAAAARSRQARKATKLLDGLIETTALHFAYEEEWMDRTGYPDRAAHRAAHDLFLQDLHTSGLELRASGVSPRIVDWACGRLQQWLRFHMEKNDRPLARYLERVATQRRPSPMSVQHRS